MVSLLGYGCYLYFGDYLVMIVALALLGMSTLPISVAITLACDNLDSSYIVAATQVMLFRIIGSAMGPIAAGTFLGQHNGLVNFFFIVLLVTAIYMLRAYVVKPVC